MKQLGMVADIFVGVQTSADAIYIVEALQETQSEVVVQGKDREWTLERGILRPCLHDVTLEAYTRPKPNKYMIFPYDLSGKRAVLLPPEQMEREFPKALAYLTAHRFELEKRNITGGGAGEQQFYQFGRSQSLQKFNRPKIILPILSLEPRYTYDDQNIVVTGGGNGPYYLIRPKGGPENVIFYLLAVLCHPLCEAMVRTRTSVFRGGYYSHGKQFIEGLPVPEPEETQRKAVEDLVQSLIATNEELGRAKTPQARIQKEREAKSLRGRIEALMTQIFGLTAEELETVRAVSAPQ